VILVFCERERMEFRATFMLFSKDSKLRLGGDLGAALSESRYERNTLPTWIGEQLGTLVSS